MKPIRTDECNFTYVLNGGTEENNLPCQVSDPDSGEQWVRSFFVHELDEELDHDALFISVLAGPGHAPPVEISMADIGENIVLPLRSVPDPMYGQVLEGDILLTDEIKAAFRDGTPLQIKVNARPTPPIRVYTADYAVPEPESVDQP